MHKSSVSLANRYRVLSSALVLAAALGGGSVASAATLPSGFSEQTFSGITNPTALAFAPDGRVFVSQQCGQIRVIKNGAVLSTPFASISVSCSDERGLHSIAFDPNFSSNGFVYVRFTRASPLNNVIGRLQASPPSSDTGGGLTVLFVVPLNGSTQRYHHGGGLVVGSDGKLYSSFGDHLSGSGQSLSNLWGKVVRINLDGSIPSDNPFFATTTGDNRAIWAYGFRNPFTMAIQPGTGRIHVNDVGNSASSGREEVNVLGRGTNFNWPNSEGPGSHFNYAAASQGGNAIVGGSFYNPTNVNFPSTYVGKYFFGDYGAGWIRYINGSGTAGSLTGFATGVSGPTDVETANDGTLWYTARNSSNVRRICFGTCPGNLPTPTPVPTATPTPIGPTPTPQPTATPTPINTLPNPTINTPPTGTIYRGGDSVSFSGSCTDAEDGTVGPGGFFWDVVFHHNTHTHPGVQFTGVTSGSFDLPTDGEWDPDQWWRVNLVCTDSDGGARTVTRDVLPKKHTLTVNSSPSGLQVAADGVTGAAPIAPEAVAGMKRILDTNAPQTMGGTTYYFQGWSDGGEKRHDVFMPDANASFTVNFLASSAYSEITPAAGSVTALTSDANVPGNTVDNDLATRWSGNGDGTWLRFDLGTTRTIGHVRVAAYQGNVRRNRFDLQVSNDGSAWTTVFSGETSGTTTNEETFDFRDVSGRYLRYLGHGNIGSTNPTMNSVTEVSIFGVTVVTPTPTPTPVTPTPTPTNTPVPTNTPTPTNTPATPPPPTPTPTPTVPSGGDVEITPGTGAVTASTNDGNIPGNAVDSDLATRWSANGDGQWLRLDLGTAQTVSYVKIASYNGNLRAIRFDIQCSSDGTTWTTLLLGAQSSGLSTALETFDVTDASCRYVRYLGHGNTVNMWNSLTEVEIWQTGGGTPPPPTPTPTNTPVAPTPTPTPTPSGTDTNLALNHPATASSIEAAGFEAGKAVDGNATSRWASAEGVDPQWIYVDLGASHSVSRVVLRWEAAFGRSYTIATSNDASTWTTIYTTTTGDGGVDDITLSGTGRYVRMHGTARGTAFGYSLFEYEVWGQ